MTSFAAIDVETANGDFASICQIGIVQFHDGHVVEAWQSLIDPEDEFDDVNIGIHGITPETVRGAPTLPRLAALIDERTAHRVVVCHTAFDRVSLTRACARYEVAVPSVTWLDSAAVARRSWPDQCGRKHYGLRPLARFLNLDFTPHVAVEDARVAGAIVLRAMADTGLDLVAMLDRVRRPIWPARSSREPGQAIDVNPEGHLAGHVAVFTGSLSMVRSDAARLAASAGCQVGSGVTTDTTLLVVGDQDLRKLSGHERSAKHRKAEALIAKGQSIRIVGERDFLLLIDHSSPAVSADPQAKRDEHP